MIQEGLDLRRVFTENGSKPTTSDEVHSTCNECVRGQFHEAEEKITNNLLI